MKKLIPILLAIFMLMGTQVALGATETKMSGSGVVSPEAFETISRGTSRIINTGNGTVNVSGKTTTYAKVEKIGLKLNVQYLSGNKWYALDNYSYTNYNSSSVSDGKSVEVTGGYYYRVSAQHTSVNGGISESTQSYSEEIYIK